MDGVWLPPSEGAQRGRQSGALHHDEAAQTKFVVTALQLQCFIVRKERSWVGWTEKSEKPTVHDLEFNRAFDEVVAAQATQAAPDPQAAVLDAMDVDAQVLGLKLGLVEALVALTHEAEQDLGRVKGTKFSRFFDADAMEESDEESEDDLL